MSVITFSRFFQKNHPRAGEPTYFVEKIWKSIYDTPYFEQMVHYEPHYQAAIPCSYDIKENIHQHQPKFHTIRKGNRWKVGDKFSPRVWSSKPYRSKQITFAPDIEIKKVWEFEISQGEFGRKEILINKESFYYEDDNSQSGGDIDSLALNDGLSTTDMFAWLQFPKPFKGQIICWNENIIY